MSSFLFKSILALIFLVTGLLALFCMLILMGQTNRKINATFLRKAHKVFGLVFFMLLLVISYFCIKYVRIAGDQLSLRAVFHSVLSLGLIMILILKILIVRFYKQFLKYAPVLGIMVFTFAFVVTSTSAGFYFLRLNNTIPEPTEESSLSSVIKGDIDRGTFLFNSKCSDCHYTDREEVKQGPSLKNLLKKEKLPHSGKPATTENVKGQLMRPARFMPAFKNLTAQEMSDLLEYLATL